MNIDIERLKVDPDYWDECGGEDFKYAFTTGANWKGSSEFVGCVEFAAREDGWQNEETELILGSDWWVLVAERPEPCLARWGESPLPKQEVSPWPLRDHYSASRIGALGNQAHSLGWVLQDDKEFADALDLIARKLWALEDQYLEKIEVEKDRNELIEIIIEDTISEIQPTRLADAILAAGWQKP